MAKAAHQLSHLHSQARLNDQQRPRKPGLLLAPFEWAAAPILRLALGEPRLLAHLTDLDTLRLHVIAFYLAHCPATDIEGIEASFLCSARSREIIARALGKPPGRLLGLLRRLPERALAPEEYRSLVLLASNEALTHVLMRSKTLSSYTVRTLALVPQALLQGSLFHAIDGDIAQLVMVTEVVGWFEERGYDDAALKFAAVANLAELSQLIYDLLSRLPPVPRLPPRLVGRATQIESLKELRQAGSIGQNCLGDCGRLLGHFKNAFYTWEDGSDPIYVGLTMYPGIGWFLSDIKLAKNAIPSAERRQLVSQAFEAVGISPEIVGDNLRGFLTNSYN